MTFLRNVIRASENFLGPKKCFVLNKNNWNVASYCSNKIELPSPPKRPLSAYMMFCQENRKDLLRDNPFLKPKEQMKILAEKWNHLTEDAKKPYEKSARENTQQYGEKHKEFYEGLTEQQKEELARLRSEKKESRQILRNKKVLRESGIPKPPTRAYALFVHSEAEKRPSENAPLAAFVRKVAELWKSLPEDSKKVFEVKAEEDKKRFSEEMDKWSSKMLKENNKKVLKAYKLLKGKDLALEEKVSKSATSKN